MRGSRNFFQGGSRPEGQKTVLATFFYFFCSSTYFTVYRGGPMGYCRENYTFSRIQRGSNIFQGGSNFFPGGGGGVQMLISIETHITCDFPGGEGGPDPLSPLWIRTWLSPGTGTARKKITWAMTRRKWHNTNQILSLKQKLWNNWYYNSRFYWKVDTPIWHLNDIWSRCTFCIYIL